MTKKPENVSAKKATVVNVAISASPNTTVTPTVNRATAVLLALPQPRVILQENAPVCTISPEKHANNAVLATTNTLNA